MLGLEVLGRIRNQWQGGCRFRCHKWRMKIGIKNMTFYETTFYRGVKNGYVNAQGKMCPLTDKLRYEPIGINL